MPLVCLTMAIALGTGSFGLFKASAAETKTSKIPEIKIDQSELKIEAELANLLRQLQTEIPESRQFIDAVVREFSGPSAIREFQRIDSQLRDKLVALNLEKKELDEILALKRSSVAAVLEANTRAFEELRKWDDLKSFLINVASSVFFSSLTYFWITARNRRRSQ